MKLHAHFISGEMLFYFEPWRACFVEFDSFNPRCWGGLVF